MNDLQHQLDNVLQPHVISLKNTIQSQTLQIDDFTQEAAGKVPLQYDLSLVVAHQFNMI